jgi:hypothetical protein
MPDDKPRPYSASARGDGLVYAPRVSSRHRGRRSTPMAVVSGASPGTFYDDTDQSRRAVEAIEIRAS